MSLIYKSIEGSCHLINALTGNRIKKYMYSQFAEAQEKDDLPQYIYKNFRVNRIEYRGFPVFVIQKRTGEKCNGKAILFLAGGGGMARPMGIHFDTAVRLVKKIGAVMYFAYYPLAPKYNVRDALEWLEGVYKAMEKSDPILNVEMNDLIAQHWSKNVPLDSPDINPKYIDFADFPEILMFYGSHELFYPHVKQLLHKMRRIACGPKRQL